ncbi:amidohydrolase family protein [Nocardia vaccinii]|uniref:amidohydrolase family protein n=1 Tax=Nocardia vaccinii TaxID=1822 RepID=UPI00082B104F|nr:amidohydrolase family protein [Nocardia vaccinii]
MSLLESAHIISVDDHLIEPPRVWQDRLPAALRERGPRIVETEKGHHVWHFDGDVYAQLGLNAVAGKPLEEYGVEPLRYDDMIPGCYDPRERVKDMDLDGVQAALCFPTFPGFGGRVFHQAKDKDLALPCVQAWNDFSIDEWCAAAPDRLIPLALVPTWDVNLAVAEVERMAGRGARAIAFPESPVPLGMPSFHTDYWDPLWSACEANDMPVCLHFGSSGITPGFSSTKSSGAGISNTNVESKEVPFAVAIALFASNLMWTTVDLLFSGALQRHPKLQFLLSEGGIGWVPYILQRTDQTWERHRHYQDIDKNTRPSELFHKHFWGCFIDDQHGLDNRYEIGIDKILLEIDFPHSDSNWPNSRKRAAEMFANVPDDEATMIAETNARRLLRFPR